MEKHTRYPNVRFDAKAFSEADTALGSDLKYISLTVKLSETEQWSYDTLQEFLAAADAGQPDYQARREFERHLTVLTYDHATSVTVRAPTRSEIESISSVFDRNSERCRLPEEEEQPEPPPKIFIGHGRKPQWRDLKDHLQDKHGYAISAYEIGSRAGHAVRDILEEILDETSFALLVMTGEDKTKAGKLRARQNVVHEAGLFQGKLGFSRAIILREKGTEEFSNLAGLQEIRFSKGRIAETFGEVLATLKREFK
jgi:predicted nucleotide-binding protein